MAEQGSEAPRAVKAEAAKRGAEGSAFTALGASLTIEGGKDWSPSFNEMVV